MYKLVSSVKDSGDLYFGFDRDPNGRQREVTNNTNKKGKYHLRIMLRDIIGFAENHKKTTYGFRCKLALTRNTDNAL